MKEKIKIGNGLIINAPVEWNLDKVKIEIFDYDYDSTEISIDELEILYNHIGEILKKYKT